MFHRRVPAQTAQKELEVVRLNQLVEQRWINGDSKHIETQVTELFSQCT